MAKTVLTSFVWKSLRGTAGAVKLAARPGATFSLSRARAQPPTRVQLAPKTWQEVYAVTGPGREDKIVYPRACLWGRAAFRLADRYYTDVVSQHLELWPNHLSKKCQSAYDVWMHVALPHVLRGVDKSWWPPALYAVTPNRLELPTWDVSVPTERLTALAPDEFWPRCGLHYAEFDVRAVWEDGHAVFPPLAPPPRPPSRLGYEARVSWDSLLNRSFRVNLPPDRPPGSHTLSFAYVTTATRDHPNGPHWTAERLTSTKDPQYRIITDWQPTGAALWYFAPLVDSVGVPVGLTPDTREVSPVFWLTPGLVYRHWAQFKGSTKSYTKKPLTPFFEFEWTYSIVGQPAWWWGFPAQHLSYAAV